MDEREKGIAVRLGDARSMLFLDTDISRQASAVAS
jgi:hypothetical protein